MEGTVEGTVETAEALGHERIVYLDASVELTEDATRADVDAALEGHVMAEAMIQGAYKR